MLSLNKITMHLFTGMIMSFQEYPKMCYKMMGDNRPLSDLPVGSWVFTGAICLLTSIYFLTVVISKYYLDRLLYFSNWRENEIVVTCYYFYSAVVSGGESEDMSDV